MPASDGIVLGELAIAASYFNAPHFEDGFTSLPGLPTAANPNTTGKFCDEHWLHGKKLEGGWADGPELGGFAVNKEKHRYTSSRAPSPDGWLPFETSSEGLKIIARRVPDTPAMKQWAIGKRYGEKPVDGTNYAGGQDLFVSDFASEGDIPGIKDYDYFIEGDGRIRWDRYQMDWQSGILNTGNYRASIDQGRFEVVGKVPIGAIYSSSGSILDQSTAFAAIWLIEQFKVGTGRNLQPLDSGNTHYPFTGSHLLNELDAGEFGGFDPYTNHNSRHVHDGTPLQLVSDGEAKYIAGLNMQQEFVRIICDITPEKIGFAIGPADGACKYTRVIDTPRAFKETRREYELESPNSGTVVTEGGIAVELGDLIIDGQIQRRQMMALMNVAMDGMWLRDRMMWEYQTILNRGYAYPAYAEVDGLNQCHMTIRSISMSALTEAKFLKANGGYYEPHKDGTDGGTGGGGTEVPVDTSTTAPVTGEGIRHSPSVRAGIETWQLEDPGLVGPGHWAYDSFGADATLIGLDTDHQLKLDVSKVAQDTPRPVYFQPDSSEVIPDPTMSHGPVEGLYVAAS